MSDLDVKRVADIAAYVERHASPAGEQRMWNAGKDFDLNCSTCRERFLLRRLADRERQLANTKFELEITENARLTDNAYLIQQRDAAEAKVAELERQFAEAQSALDLACQFGPLVQAEAKLRAVAALRDELRDGLRPSPMEKVIVNRLDAILGGDK